MFEGLWRILCLSWVIVGLLSQQGDTVFRGECRSEGFFRTVTSSKCDYFTFYANKVKNTSCLETTEINHILCNVTFSYCRQKFSREHR